MAELLEQRSTMGVKLETTYGVDPTLASTDVIEFLKDSNFPMFEPDVKERNVIRNTFSKLASLRGAELNASGTLGVELHGSGTQGTAPETDPLWECAVGVKNVSTASTTTTGSTTTSVVLTPGGGAGFAVGDAVRVNIATPQIVWITAKSTDTLTVSPALAQAPGSGVAVQAGVHYKLSKNEMKSFWTSLWRGDAVRYDFPGCRVSKLAMNFSTGEIITPKFDYMSRSTVAPVNQAYGLGLPSYDSTDPLVAVNMSVKVGGTMFDVSDCAFEIDNAVFKRQAVTTAGITKVVRTGRAVSGSFSLLYEDKAIEDAMRADTKSELIVIAGSTAGNIFTVRFPQIRYTKVPVSVTDGIYKYDVSWEAEPVSSSGEDECSVHFL